MSERRDGLLALCVFAFLFSIYLLTFSGRYHSSDEMSMLAVSDSLARRGALDINLYRWLGLQQGKFGPEGNLYSHKGLGTSLAALPLTWLALQSSRLGNVQTAMLTMTLVTALTGALLFLTVRRLRFRQGAALGVALLYGLATMAWVYARYLFSESLTGLALLAAAYLLLCYRDQGRIRDVLLAGVCLGVTLLTRLNDALVMPLFALLLGACAWQRGKRTPRCLAGLLALMGLPLIVALAGNGLYNTLRFGNPLDTGYLFGQREQFSTPLFVGLYGLTFSPGRGLFWYNPILLAALAGWPALNRRRRTEGLFAAGVALYYLLFWSLWYLWWGGHSWGPRFLVAMLPFALLSLAPVLDAARKHRALAVGLAVLVILSVAVQLLGVVVDFNLYLNEIYDELGLYHPATLFNPAYSPLLRQIAYVRPENLDVAWARGGTVNWGGLACGLVLFGLSGLALWAAWRGRLGKVLSGLALCILAVGTVMLLFFYAPTGDVAQAAVLLARMEGPGEAAALTGEAAALTGEAAALTGEAAALTDPFLTEPWQDAYDGRLWVWGVPSKDKVGAGQKATWVLGPGDPEPAAACFQVGAVRLDYYPPPGLPFDAARLPTALLEEQAYLGDVVELVATQIDEATVQPGEMLPVALYWRAVESMTASYTVFVQVVAEDRAKAGQVDYLPCNGGCPTTTWRPGDLIGEWYEVPIRADAPPGHYQIIAGMYDLESGENLLAEDGRPYLTLGSIQIEP